MATETDNNTSGMTAEERAREAMRQRDLAEERYREQADLFKVVDPFGLADDVEANRNRATDEGNQARGEEALRQMGDRGELGKIEYDRYVKWGRREAERREETERLYRNDNETGQLATVTNEAEGERLLAMLNSKGERLYDKQYNQQSADDINSLVGLTRARGMEREIDGLRQQTQDYLDFQKDVATARQQIIKGNGAGNMRLSSDSEFISEEDYQGLKSRYDAFAAVQSENNPDFKPVDLPAEYVKPPSKEAVQNVSIKMDNGYLPEPDPELKAKEGGVDNERTVNDALWAVDGPKNLSAGDNGFIYGLKYVGDANFSKAKFEGMLRQGYTELAESVYEKAGGAQATAGTELMKDEDFNEAVATGALSKEQIQDQIKLSYKDRFIKSFVASKEHEISLLTNEYVDSGLTDNLQNRMAQLATMVKNPEVLAAEFREIGPDGKERSLLDADAHMTKATLTKEGLESKFVTEVLEKSPYVKDAEGNTVDVPMRDGENSKTGEIFFKKDPELMASRLMRGVSELEGVGVKTEFIASMSGENYYDSAAAGVAAVGKAIRNGADKDGSYRKALIADAREQNPEKPSNPYVQDYFAKKGGEWNEYERKVENGQDAEKPRGNEFAPQRSERQKLARRETIKSVTGASDEDARMIAGEEKASQIAENKPQNGDGKKEPSAADRAAAEVTQKMGINTNELLDISRTMQMAGMNPSQTRDARPSSVDGNAVERSGDEVLVVNNAPKSQDAPTPG